MAVCEWGSSNLSLILGRLLFGEPPSISLGLSSWVGQDTGKSLPVSCVEHTDLAANILGAREWTGVGRVSLLDAVDPPPAVPAVPFLESLFAKNSLPGCCQSPSATSWNVKRDLGI